jgi:hypothetical protein
MEKFKIRDEVVFTTLKHKDSKYNNNWKDCDISKVYTVEGDSTFDFNFGQEDCYALKGYTNGWIPGAILKKTFKNNNYGRKV